VQGTCSGCPGAGTQGADGGVSPASGPAGHDRGRQERKRAHQKLSATVRAGAGRRGAKEKRLG